MVLSDRSWYNRATVERVVGFCTDAGYEEFPRSAPEFEHTDTDESPWYVIDIEVKKHARLNCISHLLAQVDYEDTMPEPTELSARQRDPSYEHPPIDGENWVPALYGSNPTASDIERS